MMTFNICFSLLLVYLTSLTSAYYRSYIPNGANEGYSAFYYADLGGANLSPESAPIDPDRTNFYYYPKSGSYRAVNHQYTTGE